MATGHGGGGYDDGINVTELSTEKDAGNFFKRDIDTADFDAVRRRYAAARSVVLWAESAALNAVHLSLGIEESSQCCGTGDFRVRQRSNKQNK